MNEENTTNEESVEEVSETKHEAHPHAQPRILIGIAAVAVVVVIGVVWVKWSESIKEFCFGENGACPIVLPDTPGEGSAELFDESNLEDFGGEGLSAVSALNVEDLTEDLPPIPDAPMPRNE